MAIQQHPIPQNVTSFQFRLVGDMTLMQFFQLAGGIVLGLVVYATALPFFIKWPLIAICVGLGAGMAFLPVEGRPMDKWLIAFIRSIYTPTIFTWQKTQYIAPTPQAPVHHTTPPQTTANVASQSFSGNAPYLNPTPVKPSQTPTTTSTPTHNPKTVVTPVVQKIHLAPPTPIKQPPKSSSTEHPAVANQPITPTKTASPSGPSPVFSTTLPIPSTPTTPNTIVGMTLTTDGKILDGAIVEIRHNTETVRATKSNKLGQFLFLKPLDNGTFQLTADHPIYGFKTYALNIKGEIVRPIKLQAFEKKLTPTTPETITPSITAIPSSPLNTSSPLTSPSSPLKTPPVTPQVFTPPAPIAAPSTTIPKPVTLVDNTPLSLPKNPPAF